MVTDVFIDLWTAHVWLNLYGPPICRISLKMTTSKGPQFWAGTFWYLELAIRGTKAKSYNGIWASFIGCSIPTSCLAILSVIFACTFPFHKIWNWVMGMQHSPGGFYDKSCLECTACYFSNVSDQREDSSDYPDITSPEQLRKFLLRKITGNPPRWHVVQLNACLIL